MYIHMHIRLGARRELEAAWPAVRRPAAAEEPTRNDYYYQKSITHARFRWNSSQNLFLVVIARFFRLPALEVSTLTKAAAEEPTRNDYY